MTDVHRGMADDTRDGASSGGGLRELAFKARDSKPFRELIDWVAAIYPKVGAGRAAESEAVASQLPGRQNGPGDANRHLLWAAELTRLFGADEAKQVLDWKERLPRDNEDDEAAAMDEHNNRLGIELGREADTWDDVVRRVRDNLSRSHRSGDGRDGGARWLPKSRWSKHPRNSQGIELTPLESNWPEIDWEGRYVPEPFKYRFGGPRHRQSPFHAPQEPLPPMASATGRRAVGDLIEAPTESLTRKDLDRLIAQDAYWHKALPGSAAVRRKVRDWFERDAERQEADNPDRLGSAAG